MSQFCIDLKDVMLPDAIAALVEAWYEAQEVEPQVALSVPAVISANNKDGMPYQPGEPIEIRDSAAPGSAWKRGWVFYKACPAKVGICEASKWNYELGMPDYIASGGGQYCGTGDVFTNPRITGCRLKQPENIRRVIVQPWENQPAQSFAG